MDLLGSSNTFDLRFSEGVHKKKVVCVVTSDRWIDGKTFKIEGSINGLSTMDLNVLGRIRFRAHDLFPLKFELEAGKYNESYKSIVIIETSMQGFEKITINAEVPMNK